MKLVYDHSDGAYAVKVRCYSCGEWQTLAHTTIDLDGPAFLAYYCKPCIREKAPHIADVVPRCARIGCARC